MINSIEQFNNSGAFPSGKIKDIPLSPDKLKPGITTVLFDLDGTVIDSCKANHIFWNNLAKLVSNDDYKYEQISLDDYKEKYFSLGRKDTIDKWTNHNAQETERILQIATDMDKEIYPYEMITLVPDAQKAINALLDAGYKIGFVTSSTRDRINKISTMQDMLEKSSVCVCAEDIEKHKPYPSPLLMACNVLGLRPENVAYVGDQLNDIVATRAAGMWAVSFGETPFGYPHAHVSSMSELPKTIVSLGEENKQPEGLKKVDTVLKTHGADLVVAGTGLTFASFSESPTGEGKKDMALAGKEIFEELAREAIEKRGKFTVSICGGTAPEDLYRFLRDIDPEILEKTYVFFGDERPPRPKDKVRMTNFEAANKGFLSYGPAHVFNMELRSEYYSEQDLLGEARRYSEQIRAVLGDNPRFDLMIVGGGGEGPLEGHIMGLMANSPAFSKENPELVEVVYRRDTIFGLTMSPKLLNADNVMVLLPEKKKIDTIRRLMVQKEVPPKFPIGILHGKDISDKATVLTDQPYTAIFDESTHPGDAKPTGKHEEYDDLTEKKMAYDLMEKSGVGKLVSEFLNKYRVLDWELYNCCYTDSLYFRTHGQPDGLRKASVLDSEVVNKNSLRFYIWRKDKSDQTNLDKYDYFLVDVNLDGTVKVEGNLHYGTNIIDISEEGTCDLEAVRMAMIHAMHWPKNHSVFHVEEDSSVLAGR
jgi:HAD superfamily hydrolase (TIGR01549 family)